MLWPQNYDPLHFWPLSTAMAALPVLTLFFVLLVLKKRVWLAALSGMAMAILLAGVALKMPMTLIVGASLHGIVFGFFQIAWIIIASIFLYNIALETGQFEVMKESIAALSSDIRIQMILIAFCFGAFLEGTGGGGAPVSPFPGRHHLPAGQHGPGGLGWSGESRAGAGRRDWPRGAGLQRHAGENPSALLVNPATLAHALLCRLEKNPGSDACLAG
jgi:hypothetical protein